MTALSSGARVVDVLDRYQPTGMGNVFLDCGDFGISFNGDPGLGVRMFAGDTSGGETAITVAGKFLILNGDFRREYAELADAGGLDACIDFFASKPELKSSWSNTVAEALAARMEPQS